MGSSVTSNTRYLVIIGGVIATLFVLAALNPSIKREDGVIEWASALIFLSASLLAAVLAGRPGWLRSRGDRVAMGGVALLALLASLSEVSFGARLFGMQMPAMKGGGEFDGGHDIVILAIRIIEDAPRVARLALVLVAALGIIAALVWAWHRRTWFGAAITAFFGHPVRFRFSIAILLLATAVALDLTPFYWLSVLEEVLECTAAIVILTTATAAAGSARRFTSRWSGNRAEA